MSWIWSALMPHPPVLVPQVGHGREKEAGPTLDGVTKLCRAVEQCKTVPDVLVVLSPHHPYVPNALFLNKSSSAQGSLARFGAPGVRVSWRSASDKLNELATALKKAGLPAAYGEMEDVSQDHGSLVPLYFLSGCFPGNTLPPVIMANPAGLTPEQALSFGRLLRGLSGQSRMAMLASGDLSHRLKTDGPYGLHPDGPVFDQAVVEALQCGTPSRLLELPPTVRENAGECGLRPVLALLGLCEGPLEIFSYEGPFGVGYCTAFRDMRED